MSKIIKIKEQTDIFLDVVLAAIADKKGEDIQIIDLQQHNGAIADFFVVCQGNSVTQVEAIADNVVKKVNENFSTQPFAKDNNRNTTWGILDYGNVFLHVFTPEARALYQIEKLWGDAPRKNVSTTTTLPE
jgi:ribosome-associated protein